MMIAMRNENYYKVQQIGNMDETPVNFDMPPSRTIHAVGKISVIVRTTGNGGKNSSQLYLVDATKLKPATVFMP